MAQVRIEGDDLVVALSGWEKLGALHSDSVRPPRHHVRRRRPSCVGARGSGLICAMRAAVTLHMDAPPDKVWGLVSDITRMGDYSPEVVEAEWLGGATGPAVGARYRGHVRRNENWPLLYWTTCEVTECVPGEVFEFAVVMRDRPVNVWRYEFRGTDDGGTDVTESFDLGDNLFTKIWRPIGGFLRERRNERDMLRTLERIKAVAEKG